MGGVAPWNPGEPNGHGFGAYNERVDGAYMFPETTEWVKAGAWDDNSIDDLKTFVCRSADSLPNKKASGSNPTAAILLSLASAGLVVGSLIYTCRHGSPCANGNIFARMRARSLMPSGSSSSTAATAGPTAEASSYVAPTPFASPLADA